MKITKTRLKEIIKEEVEKILNEERPFPRVDAINEPYMVDDEVSFMDKAKGVFGMGDKKMDQTIKRFKNIMYDLEQDGFSDLESLEKARKTLMATYDARKKEGAVSKDQKREVTKLHNDAIEMIRIGGEEQVERDQRRKDWGIEETSAMGAGAVAGYSGPVKKEDKLSPKQSKEMDTDKDGDIDAKDLKALRLKEDGWDEPHV